MPERRKSDRRTNPAVPEPLERKKERRQGDRRDSFRKKAHLVVMDGETSHHVAGDVGLGGAAFVLPTALKARALVVALRVGTKTLELPGTVTDARGPRASSQRVLVTFDGLETATELALARWLDDGP